MWLFSTLIPSIDYSKLNFKNVDIIGEGKTIFVCENVTFNTIYDIKLKLKQTLNKTSQYIANKIVGIEETFKYILNKE